MCQCIIRQIIKIDITFFKIAFFKCENDKSCLRNLMYACQKLGSSWPNEKCGFINGIAIENGIV